MNFSSCHIPPVQQTANVTDNSGNFTVTYADIIVSDFRNKSCPANKTMLVISRNVTATDPCGNSQSLTQLLTFIDTTSPTFIAASVLCTALAYTSQQAYTGCGHPTSIFDDCGVNPNQATYLGSGTNPTPFYATQQTQPFTQTWTIYDMCGNYASEVQTVTPI